MMSFTTAIVKDHDGGGTRRAVFSVAVGLMLSLLFVPGAGVASVTSATQAGKANGEALCRKVELRGEVSAGQEWSAAIGEGWVFRVVPIAPSGKGYSGWDLVVDRGEGGEYPDALLLATPPYGSLNEREIGTTFGMRAQDAIAWSPRRFRLLTSARELEQAKASFHIVMAGPSGSDASKRNKAESELLKLVEGASSGRFDVLEARLTAGVGDPPLFAAQWAMHLSKVPHTLVPSGGTPSERGELRWMRFTATLWLPKKWSPGNSAHADLAKCAQ